MFANLPYHTANGFELRLTIYSPKALAGATRTMTQPNPTLIYFMAGGGDRQQGAFGAGYPDLP